METPVFSDSFLEDLPADPKFAQTACAKQFKKIWANFQAKGQNIEYADFLSAFAIFQSLSRDKGWDLNFPDLQITSHHNQVLNQIFSFFNQLEESNKEYCRSKSFEAETLKIIEEAQLKYAAHVGKTVAFEFTDADIAEMQKLLNRLRDLILQSKQLDDLHRRRVLKKLEALQSELYKTVSDLDHFYGVIMEGFNVARKCSEDATVILDTVKKFLVIVWSAHATYMGLPQTTPPLQLTGGDATGARTPNQP